MKSSNPMPSGPARAANASAWRSTKVRVGTPAASAARTFLRA
jgi:hypothetical protein